MSLPLEYIPSLPSGANPVLKPLVYVPSLPSGYVPSQELSKEVATRKAKVERQRRYRATPKGKATEATVSPNQKAIDAKKNKKYKASPKGKAWMSKHRTTPEYKAKQAAWLKCRGGVQGVCVNGHFGRSKYDWRCVQCFIDKHPNDPRAHKAKKYLRAKELSVRAFLDEVFPEYHWTFDRAYVKTALCGRLVRPDAKTTLGKTRVLIVEVDEDSHDTYICGDERERERIFAKFAPRDALVHLIRFNPDAYHPVTGQRVPSCFRFSKVEGLVSVNPKCRADWEFRLATLRQTIQEIIDHQHLAVEVPPIIKEEDDRYAHVVPIELFYDDVRAKYGVSGHALKHLRLGHGRA